MCRFTPRATAIARGNKPTHFHNLRTLQVIPSGEKPLWKCVVCYLWWQIDSSLFPALFSIYVRCFIYGADICSIVVLASAQAENIVRWLTEKEWMVSSQSERRHSGHKIYHEPITAGKKHRPDPSWSGRCVCLAEIFPVCFHPLKPPGVRHCTMELSEVSISIPLRFFYWNLTDEWISMGRKRMKIVIHGWLGGTQLLWFSEFCHPASLKHRWKHGIRWVEKPEFVMLDALVFWITFSGFPEKLIPADSADTAETHGFKAFPGFWQGKPLIQSGSISEYHLFTEKQSSFPSEHRYPISTRNSLTPVTHRDHPCCPFPAGIGRCTMSQVYRLVGSMWNNHFFLKIEKIVGSKCVPVKGGWHKATRPEDIAQQS